MVWATFEKIILGNVLFGGSYKVAILWNGEIESWVEESLPQQQQTKKKIMRPMLMGEKIMAFMWGTAMSPVLAPLWMCHQLNYLDMYMQGKKPKELGYESPRRCIMDYVFT